MAALVNVTRKSEVLQGFPLEAPADMFTALEYMQAREYTGYINVDLSGTWTLGLIGPNQTNQSAKVGDWIVIKNGVSAEIVPAAQAGELYQVI